MLPLKFTLELSERTDLMMYEALVFVVVCRDVISSGNWSELYPIVRIMTRRVECWFSRFAVIVFRFFQPFFRIAVMESVEFFPTVIVHEGRLSVTIVFEVLGASFTSFCSFVNIF